MADVSTYRSNTRFDTLRETLSDAFTAPIRFDPLGIVSGFKAYRVYTELSEKSDDELAALGLDRLDVPQAAIEAVSAK